MSGKSRYNEIQESSDLFFFFWMDQSLWGYPFFNHETRARKIIDILQS